MDRANCLYYSAQQCKSSVCHTVSPFFPGIRACTRLPVPIMLRFSSFRSPFLSLSRFDSIRLGIPRGGRDQLVGRGEEGRRQCRKISPPSLKVESFTSSRRNPTFGRENEKGEPSGGGEGRGGGGRVRCLYSKVKSTVRYATKQVWPLGIY